MSRRTSFLLLTGPYQIPYGVMVPEEHDGILFPVCISSTHVAMCSVRMEPVWSGLGQAAGVAAALAIERESELADLSVSEIQGELENRVVSFYSSRTCQEKRLPLKPFRCLA
ncbi:MAG: FAD-dependent oxidoreductase [Verrucomicrobiota bacterium]